MWRESRTEDRDGGKGSRGGGERKRMDGIDETGVGMMRALMGGGRLSKTESDHAQQP